MTLVRNSLRRSTQLSDLPSNQILNTCRGWISVVKPIARINLITNPSFETATTNYTAVGGSIARSTTFQHHGAYSLAVTPGAATTDGVFYGTVSLTSGTPYAASCKFLGVAGVKYKISFATTGGVDLVAYTFIATGKWQWVWVYWNETSTTTRRIYFTKSGSTSTAIFYIDGVQVEALVAGETVSTYIDGDQQSLLAFGQFPPAYKWNGSPHASTSTRSAQTRDGGMVFNFDFYRFLITSIAGLGLVDPTHLAASTGLVDGASYQTSIVPQREFTVGGRFNTQSAQELDRARSALGVALGLDATAPRQPIALLYQQYEGLLPAGDVGKMVASYKTGLGATTDNVVGEQASVGFTQWLPFIGGADSGGSITVNESISVSNVFSVMRRDDNGDWSLLHTSATLNQVTDIKVHPVTGLVYFVGSFTTIGGTAANRVASYDPTTNTFSALGTGLNGTGLTIRIAPDGDVYVGGTFTTAGGVTVNNIARWDGAAWNALGAGATKGVDSTVTDAAFDGNGLLYLTGDFVNAGGAGANRIVRYSPITNGFTALGTGLDGGGTAIIAGVDNKVYVGGNFTLANGVAATRIAVWNGTTFAALSSGVNVAPNKLRVGPDTNIYAAGGFSTAGGLTVNYVARWNGFQWTSLGAGLSDTAGELEYSADGLLYIGGSGIWTTVNGSIAVSDSFAGWNGSNYVLPDIEMPGNTSVSALATSPGGGLYLAFNSDASGTALAAQTNTLQNDGTAIAYATWYITGPASGTARLYQMRSYTTNKIISFDLLIQPEEQLTIRMTPGTIAITSTFRGNITTAVVPGSAGDFPLLRGANSVTCFSTGVITVRAIWQKQYQAVADLTY